MKVGCFLSLMAVLAALVSNCGDDTITVADFAAARVVKTFTAGTGVEVLACH